MTTRVGLLGLATVAGGYGWMSGAVETVRAGVGVALLCTAGVAATEAAVGLLCPANAVEAGAGVVVVRGFGAGLRCAVVAHEFVAGVRFTVVGAGLLGMSRFGAGVRCTVGVAGFWRFGAGRTAGLICDATVEGLGWVTLGFRRGCVGGAGLRTGGAIGVARAVAALAVGGSGAPAGGLLSGPQRKMRVDIVRCPCSPVLAGAAPTIVIISPVSAARTRKTGAPFGWRQARYS